MSKTIQKTKNQFEKDLAEARKLITAYAELQKEKATTEANMKAAKESLEKFATKYKKDFDNKRNFILNEDGYLHFGDESQIVIGGEFYLKDSGVFTRKDEDEKLTLAEVLKINPDIKFSWSVMLSKFPALLKWGINKTNLQKLLLNGDESKKVRNIDLDIELIEKFEVKTYKESKNI